MSSFTFLLALLAFAASPVVANIACSSPVASTTCKGGGKCNIAWKDDGKSPSTSSFGETTVGLYVGNQWQQTMVQDFGNIDPTQTTSISPTIDATAGADSDGYFIRFSSLTASDSDGNPLEAFTAMFTLTGMTGTFSPSIQAQMSGITSGGNEVFTATGGAAATISAEPSASASGTSASASGSSSEDSAAAPSARAGGLAALVATVVGIVMA